MTEAEYRKAVNDCVARLQMSAIGIPRSNAKRKINILPKESVYVILDARRGNLGAGSVYGYPKTQRNAAAAEMRDQHLTPKRLGAIAGWKRRKGETNAG